MCFDPAMYNKSVPEQYPRADDNMFLGSARDEKIIRAKRNIGDLVADPYGTQRSALAAQDTADVVRGQGFYAPPATKGPF